MRNGHGSPLKRRPSHYCASSHPGTVSDARGRNVRGPTVQNRDIMVMDHNRLGYTNGDGPANRYIEDGGCDGGDIPRRWGPIVTIREDNTTCISTNLSGKNWQMKGLERAFGAYVSWNCSRLNSGDYEIMYTRSHDMTADISTKGIDDACLYARLSLLMNLYPHSNGGAALLDRPPCYQIRVQPLGTLISTRV